MCFVCVCSCTYLELDEENFCSPYVSHMIFNYANESYFEMVANRIDQIKVVLDLSSEKCRISARLLSCSVLFIPCNLTTGAPIPLCSNDCYSFDSICENEISTLVDIGKLNNFPMIKNCENTLSHLNTLINYPNSSSDFKDNCLALPRIPGKYVLCSVSGQY